MHIYNKQKPRKIRIISNLPYSTRPFLLVDLRGVEPFIKSLSKLSIAWVYKFRDKFRDKFFMKAYHRKIFQPVFQVEKLCLFVHVYILS